MTEPFRPSFGFARRRGVTVGEPDAEGRPRLLVRVPADLEALREVRRHLDGAVVVEKLDATAYGEAIARLYAAGDEDARRVAADLGEELDLARLAEQLPEPSDLLESADDAPVIRLINGVLSQAVRDGASDVHVEPFEDRLAIRFRSTAC